MNKCIQIAVFLAVLVAASEAMAQGPGTYPSDNGTAMPAATSSMQSSTQNPFSGSVPTGTVSTEVISLSLSDAIDRGLRQNLGLLIGNDDVLSSRGRLGQARSALLPNFSANLSETLTQEDLASLGFEKLSKFFPGPGFPAVVGPFNYFDARAGVTQSVVDLSALRNERAAAESLNADKLNLQDMREVVVLVITSSYLQAIATQARVDTVQAQVQTAKALLDQTTDQKNAGLAAGIDLLRAQVELQTQQQQLIAAQNDFSKQKLSLARAIGLPMAQPFALSDTAPYEPPAPVNLEEQMKSAYASRGDFQGAQARVQSAESALRAAAAEHLPSLTAHADYGDTGINPSQSHGSFTAYGNLHIPIFAGNRTRADETVAQSDLDRNRQELENLRAQIEQEIRTAALDLQSASDQVSVARNSVDLAQQALTQSRDRFRAGVTDNIEVVQAQEAVASINESYISSLYAYNLARVQLARATGTAERSVREYWKGK
jgi:outer membrane protein TolC